MAVAQASLLRNAAPHLLLISEIRPAPADWLRPRSRIRRSIEVCLSPRVRLAPRDVAVILHVPGLYLRCESSSGHLSSALTQSVTISFSMLAAQSHSLHLS